jgi:hypothetical protein
MMSEVIAIAIAIAIANAHWRTCGHLWHRTSQRRSRPAACEKHRESGNDKSKKSMATDHSHHFVTWFAPYKDKVTARTTSRDISTGCDSLPIMAVSRSAGSRGIKSGLTCGAL